MHHAARFIGVCRASDGSQTRPGCGATVYPHGWCPPGILSTGGEESCDEDDDTSNSLAGKPMYWDTRCPLVFPTLRVTFRQNTLFKFMIRLLKQNGGVTFDSETELFNLEIQLMGMPDCHRLTKLYLEHAWLVWSLARRHQYYRPCEVTPPHIPVCLNLLNCICQSGVCDQRPLISHLTFLSGTVHPN